MSRSPVRIRSVAPKILRICVENRNVRRIFCFYFGVFKKIQRKTQRCLQNGAKKKHANINVSACFLVRVVGVEQLKLMCYRQKRTINSQKSEGITQLCWLMPNSFFDI